MSDHPRGRMVGWVLLALAGLAVAVLLSVAASSLSTQPIGLSGEPLRAGDKLAPANVTRTQATVTRVPRKPKSHTQTQPLPVPTTTTNSGSGSSGSSADSDRDRGRETERDSDDD